MIKLLANNHKTWIKYQDLIKSASKSILVVVWFVFEKDFVIDTVEKLLIKKLAEGLDVTIIYTNNNIQKLEMIMTGEDEGLTKTNAFINRMKSAGATTIDFTDVDKQRGTHRKALIIDNYKCIIGSRNVHKFYYTDPIEKNPLSHIEADIYIKDHKLVPKISKVLKFEINSDNVVDKYTHFVQSIPKPRWYDFFLNRPNTIEDMYVDLINYSNHSIVIVNCTAMYRPNIKHALKSALKRGLKVVIFANDQTQIKYQADPAELFFDELRSLS